jgi:cellulose synthase operon protein C
VIQAGLREQPDNLNFRFSSAGLNILKGDHDAAISEYDSILKQQPTSLVAINNLASLLLDYRSDRGSLDRAISLTDALKNSNIPQFQDTLGWAQYRQGDYKSSISTLEKTLEKLPNVAAVHYHLGMSYAAVGQSEKADEQLKAALALEPDGTVLKEAIRAAMK